MFYFQPIKELPKEFNAPQSRLLYSSEAVHQLIKKINSEGFDQEMPEEDKLLANGYDYERLLVQLSNYFNMERDDHERKKIIANIIGYDFSKPSSKLNEILSKYDLEDQKKLKSKIFAYAVHHHDQRRLIDEITTGYYSFDRKNLEKLRQMESGAVRRELEKIANKITIDKSPGELPNILRPCPADDCINGKMPIAKAKRDKYLDIIAKSIKEPIIESVRERIEMNKFYKRPLEKITIQAI
jgi:hypothetical protein